MKQAKTPCIKICVFAGPKGWCVGCGRTQKECEQWKSMKPYDRKTIEKSLKKRLDSR